METKTTVNYKGLQISLTQFFCIKGFRFILWCILIPCLLWEKIAHTTLPIRTRINNYMETPLFDEDKSIGFKILDGVLLFVTLLVIICTATLAHANPVENTDNSSYVEVYQDNNMTSYIDLKSVVKSSELIAPDGSKDFIYTYNFVDVNHVDWKPQYIQSKVMVNQDHETFYIQFNDDWIQVKPDDSEFSGNYKIARDIWDYVKTNNGGKE